jgi:ABC-type amino acid transport substrate-binding protein
MTFKNAILLSFGLFMAFCSRASENQIQDREKLLVAVYISPPFGMIMPDSSIGGLSVEMWQAIAHELELDFELYPENVDGILTGLNEGVYDVAIGALTITPQREKQVDFTHAVNPSGTGFAVHADSKKEAFRSYWLPILINFFRLVSILFFGILFFGALIWLTERHHLKEIDHDRKILDLWESLWWAVVTMSTVGYGDKVPLSRTGKLIAIVWIFSSIILVSLFTARASSIFTVAELELHIQTEDDLRKRTVGAASKSSGEEFCIRRNLNYVVYDLVDEALDALVEGEIDAVISNVPVMQYMRFKKYKDQIQISPNYLLRNNMGIALPHGSSLRESLNDVILIKAGEPEWRQRIEKYLGEY